MNRNEMYWWDNKYIMEIQKDNSREETTKKTYITKFKICVPNGNINKKLWNLFLEKL